MQRIANTDALTGLANRHAAARALEERLGRILEPLTGMLLDLDHFKRYNDGHGYLDGNAGQEPAAIAEAVRAALAAAPVMFEGIAIPVTVSIGLATAFATDNIDALLAEADAALYRAKDSGRNRVVYGGTPVKVG